ncbi:hypothetical protein IGI39_004107 [Enterococcus sp. AZ135]|uniref:DUF2922 family protein n=1 Tax=unclassified Enterococcus TaxID=2608891 RepID=UPI003F253C47
MRRLVATFKNSAGKSHRWSMKEPVSKKSPKEIRAALEKFTAMNLFEKNHTKLFQEVVNAKFIEIIEIPIFAENDEAAAMKETVQDPNGFAIQLVDEMEDGIQQIDLTLPDGRDITMVSEDELAAMFNENLLNDTILGSLCYQRAEKVSKNEVLKNAEIKTQKIKNSTNNTKKPKRVNQLLLDRFKKYKT